MSCKGYEYEILNILFSPNRKAVGNNKGSSILLISSQPGKRPALMSTPTGGTELCGLY